MHLLCAGAFASQPPMSSISVFDVIRGVAPHLDRGWLFPASVDGGAPVGAPRCPQLWGLIDVYILAFSTLALATARVLGSRGCAAAVSTSWAAFVWIHLAELLACDASRDALPAQAPGACAQLELMVQVGDLSDAS